MSKFLLFTFLTLTFLANAQNDTIRIQRVRNDIYKCKTKSALSWYLYTSNETITLADLKIQPKEVEGWFQRFGNSQNLYKANYIFENSKILYFKKTNEPLDTLIFEVKEMNFTNIILEIQPSKELFEFEIFRM